MKKSSLGFILLALTGVLGILAGAGCVLRDADRAPEMMTNFTQSRPLAGESELRVTVRFRVGHIIVGAAPENTLYSLDADYDSARYKPTADYDAASHRLDFRLGGSREVDFGSDRIKIGFGNSGDSLHVKNRLNLLISPKVALELDLTAGVGETKVNLTNLQTRSLEIESGVSTTFLSCESPNNITCDRLRFRAGVGKFEALQLGNLNFRQLDFEGGIGSSRLDFSGQWRDRADVSVKMGIGELVVSLPPQIGAEVDSAKRFLSGLHLESFSQRGGSYYSDNYESAKHRVRFRLVTGIGSIRVRWL